MDVQSTIAQVQFLMPNIVDLQISLFKEDDVDFIIQNLTQLQYLNNIAVDSTSSPTKSSGVKDSNKSSQKENAHQKQSFQ